MNGILGADFGKDFPIKTVFDYQPGALEQHVLTNLGRDLPRLQYQPWRSETLCVVGSGPSAADTLSEMRQPMVSSNGGLGWLWRKGIVPEACAVVDPRPHLAELVDIIPGVTYYVAVSCHPTLVDELVKARADVVLWFPNGDASQFAYPEDIIVPGCTTVGLRWIDLGAILGYHSFALHGMDSSFRRNDGTLQTHVHPDRADSEADFSTMMCGYPTGRAFIEQVREFFHRLPVWKNSGLDIKVYGEGLLQHFIRESPEYAQLLCNSD